MHRNDRFRAVRSKVGFAKAMFRPHRVGCHKKQEEAALVYAIGEFVPPALPRRDTFVEPQVEATIVKLAKLRKNEIRVSMRIAYEDEWIVAAIRCEWRLQ